MTRSRPLALIAAAHTLIWLSIESCVVYVLGAGLVGRSDRSVAIAGTIVAAETLVFAANGFRCPLTDLAESHGAPHGSVTDIYLPAWIAHNLPGIHVPIILLAVVLHGRNIRQRCRRPVPGTAGRRRDETVAELVSSRLPLDRAAGPPWPGRGPLPLPLRASNG